MSTSFWTAGGASGCQGAWQARLAASYADSLLDLSGSANDLTENASAPGWTTATGWRMQGDANWLDTGIDPSPATATWTLIALFEGASGADVCVIGGEFLKLSPRGGGGTQREYSAGDSTQRDVTGALTGGCMCVAGTNCYLDGAPDGTTSGATSAGSGMTIKIGTNGEAEELGGAVTILAAAVYDTVLTEAEQAAVRAAMLAACGMNPDYAFETGPIRVEIRDPAGAVRSVLSAADPYVRIEAEQGLFSWYRCEVTLPPDHPVLNELYDGTSLYDEHAGWTLWVIYWDYDWRDGSQPGASREDCFAKCAIVGMVDEDVNEGGTTVDDLGYTVRLVGEGLTDNIVGSRLCMNATWARYKHAGGAASVSDILANMVNAQTDNSHRPEPYEDEGGDREVYGPGGMFPRGAGAVVATASATMKSEWRVDSGRSLLDTSREYSKKYDLGWAFYVSLSSWGEWSLSLFDGHGADRTTGTSGRVTFSRGLGNLVKVRREKDDTGTSSMFFGGGQGFRARERIGWHKDTAAYARLGCRETGERHDTAWSHEIAYNTGNLATVFGHGYENYELTLRDDGATRFGWEYAVGDVVRAIDEKRQKIILKMVTKIKIAAGSPTHVVLSLGDLPSYMTDEGGGSGRASGGGAGHRRMGGVPKATGGEPGVPNRWHPDTGADPVQFDNANDDVDVKGDPDVDFNGFMTRGVDEGDGEGEDNDTFEALYGIACLKLADGPIPTRIDTYHVELSGTFAVECIDPEATTAILAVTGTMWCAPETLKTCTFSFENWPCCPCPDNLQTTVEFEFDIEVEVPDFSAKVGACVYDCDGNVVGTRTFPAFDEEAECTAPEAAAEAAEARIAEGVARGLKRGRSVDIKVTGPAKRVALATLRTTASGARIVASGGCCGNEIDPADLVGITKED